MTKLYNRPNLQPYVSSECRKGDIRHCHADIRKARKLLNYEPSISLEDGLIELADWARTHRWDSVDLLDKALHELRKKRLVT